MRFDYTIFHVPGKSLFTADTLSWSPQDHTFKDQNVAQLTEDEVATITWQLPATKDRLDAYREAQAEDSVCSQLIKFSQTSWPEKHKLSGELKKYWSVRDDLTVCDKLLLYGTRIVVPKQLQHETLCKIHHGHQGIERCRLRVMTSVWWPGVSSKMEDFIKQCSTCMKLTPPVREPILSSILPKYPWERVGTDIFQLNKHTYLLIVDYFSRYPEVIRLTTTTSSSVIAALKSVFSRHGIPETVIIDNGPQYDSKEMKEFASTYGFKHVTSSPYYPRGNGLAKRMVKTVKALLKESSDVYLAILSYRATPLPWCRLSPAVLLMGRRIRTDVPQVSNLLVPNWSHLCDFAEKDARYKKQQKEHYDLCHRTRPVPSLPDDSEVWVNMQDQQVPGRVNTSCSTPRSYVITTPTGQIRRNRFHLNERTETPPTEEAIPVVQTNRPVTRSLTGTVTRPPDRLTYT